MTSKKRSGTSTARRKQPQVIFFVDRCLESRSLVESLVEAGAVVRRHSEFFKPDASDQHWLPEVGEKGWVVLTKDKNIRRNELERDALLAAGVRAFVLTLGNLTGDETAAILSSHLVKMRNMAISVPAPFVANVTRTSIRIMQRGRRK